MYSTCTDVHVPSSHSNTIKSFKSYSMYKATPNAPEMRPYIMYMYRYKMGGLSWGGKHFFLMLKIKLTYLWHGEVAFVEGVASLEISGSVPYKKGATVFRFLWVNNEQIHTSSCNLCHIPGLYPGITSESINAMQCTY